MNPELTPEEIILLQDDSNEIRTWELITKAQRQKIYNWGMGTCTKHPLDSVDCGLKINDKLSLHPSFIKQGKIYYKYRFECPLCWGELNK